MSVLTRLKADELTIVDKLLANDAFWERFQNDLADELTPRFKLIFLAGARIGAEQPLRREKAQPLPAEPLPPPSAAELDRIADKAIQEYVPKFTKGISDTTYDRVKTAVIESRHDGSGVEGVMKRIGPMFSPTRAEAIAVTETTRLMGMGSQAMYAARGINGWEWETANDPQVDRQECWELQGKQYPITQDFQPAHPRCRCWPAPVMLANAPAVEPAAVDWANAGSDPKITGAITDDGKLGIKWYQTDAPGQFGASVKWSDLNTALRSGEPLSAELKVWKDRLDAIQTVTSVDAKLYRGMPVDALRTLMAGHPEILQDAAFVSTTQDLATARSIGRQIVDVRGDVEFTHGMMEIRVPSGSRAIDVAKWGSDTGQEIQEVVLPADTRFKVVSVDDVVTDKKGYITRGVHVVLEAMP